MYNYYYLNFETLSPYKYFHFHTRLILYSFELFGILNILIVKIWKLYYNINKIIDHEKWFCCHIIDKYWLHSLYIINYEIFGRPSNLLLFSTVYFSFGLLIITFSSILTSFNNIFIEYITLFIISIIPIATISFKLYKDIKYKEKYFVDDHYMLKEIIICIITSIIITAPPLITIYLFNYYIVLIIEIITNTFSCSLLIIISLKCGVWAAINRQNILDQEKNKLQFNDLDNPDNIHSGIDYYDKFDHGNVFLLCFFNLCIL